MRVIPKLRHFPGVPTAFSFLLFSALGTLLVVSSHAQITLDGTLGPKGPLSGPDYIIRANLGKTYGNNLFHSFEDFNIRKWESATFRGPANIEHIIARVTGGDPSHIFGHLSCTIEGADLFLINPYGVIFGEKAQLDVKGSFYVSTADELRFADGKVFSAKLTEPSVLSSAKPEAFGFLSAHPAPIIAESCTLSVPEGETLQLVGGDITLRDASLNATSGRIDLVSTASEGWVSLEDPISSMDAFDELGNINISQWSSIDTSGDAGGGVRILGGELVIKNAFVYSETSGNQDGEGIALLGRDKIVLSKSTVSSSTSSKGKAGDISIAGGNLTLSNGSRIASETYAEGDGGNIFISMDDAVVIKGLKGMEDSDSFISSSAETGSTGKAGNITIDARKLTMHERSNIDSSTYGSGAGGDINITLTDSLLMRGYGCYIGSGAFRENRGGNISISSPSMTLEDGAHIYTSSEQEGSAGDIKIRGETLILHNMSHIDSQTYGTGNGGNIFISMDDSIVIEGLKGIEDSDSGISASAEKGSTGNAGNITIDARKMSMYELSYIDSSTYGKGAGGDITITLTDSLLMRGYGCYIGSGAFRENRGGNISISSPTLTLEDRAHISTSSEQEGSAGDINIRGDTLRLHNKSHIASETRGEGDGGKIFISMDDAVIIEGLAGTEGRESYISTSAKDGSTGKAGKITMKTSLLTMRYGSYLESSSRGSGNAGDITIMPAAQILRLLLDGSGIRTEAQHADGGNIRIRGGSLVEMHDGHISASVGGGPGTTGGNVLIDSEFVVMEKSSITANAFEGQGGRIQIAGSLLADPSSIVEAEAKSRLGIDGVVDIRASIRDLAEVVEPLPKDFVSAPDLLREACEKRYREKKQGSLLVKGRDGLPFEPEMPLPSPLP